MSRPSRRRFLYQAAELGLAVAGVPLLLGCDVRSSSSKGPAKVWRIGLLFARPDPALVKGLEEELRTLGYIVGTNLTFEYREAERREDRLPGLAAELVQLNCDVIIALAAAAVRAAKDATKTIPIILLIAGDPVEGGLVASYARPGGNVTGRTSAARDLAGKRLQLLKQTVPTVARVGFLWDPGEPVQEPMYRETLAAAQTLGIEVVSLEVRAPEDFDGAFAIATQARVDALLTAMGGPTIVINTPKIVEFATRSRLPSMVINRPGVDAGALMTYVPDESDWAPLVAGYVDKIFKGTKPNDLPVLTPTRFQFLINLKTARALGLTLPPSILAQATEVIE